MFLPTYRAWVVVLLAGGLPRHLVRDRTHQARRLPARRDREPDLVQAFGVNVPRMITLTYGFGVGAGRAGRRAWPRRSIRSVRTMGAEPDHRRVRGGGDRRHGLDHGLDRHRLRARPDRGPDQGVLSGGVQHGDLRHHGDRAAGPAGRPVRTQK